ncbi:MAG: FAD-dependent oxidoreductase [Anaerolineales bacterium]|nr:FAD-dependent oxidoreductase [Chloroflexota bacterium]MBL6980330.1 FAD-dependent oxidoreductase [Anaerolineales bacterium]
MSKGALIIGGSMAGLQAALDLADSGNPVHLVASSPFLGSDTSENIAPHLMNARSLEVLRHPLITVWTNTDLNSVHNDAGGFRVDLHQKPRYVDISRCTACKNCIDVCPVTVPGDDRKAIFLAGQPGVSAIERPGKAPCSGTCPGGIHVQGYVALIAQKRYQEAIELIREAIPFPSVCGRVCNHNCEANCTRGKVDEPLNIMALKRFVADWEYDHRADLAEKVLPEKLPDPNGFKIAIIGAGPSGLTAARDLVRLGYEVTVFDALPVAGGMMRVGIPPHRLPTDELDWEIQQILDEGVRLELDTWIDDIPGLLENGFDAALIATGAHRAKKIPIPNSDHPENWLSLDLLRQTCLGEKIDLSGKKAIVLGGGNVALDSARTAVRLGAEEVRMVCLEPRGEMPGFEWEIGVAEEEGVEMRPGRTFKEIVVENNKILGVRCAEINFRGFKNGRPDFDEIPDSEHILPADLVIWAIGQEPNFSFLPQDGSIGASSPFGIISDENLMTTLPGIFVSGDVRRGQTFFVIDAIGDGHKAARSIDRYLQGEKGIQDPITLEMVDFTKEESITRFEDSQASDQPRVEIPAISVDDWVGNFVEVDLPLSEEQAITEASRCLVCGTCSECLACVAVCEVNAIDHNEKGHHTTVNISNIIYADYADVPANLDHAEGQGFYQIAPDDVLMGSAVVARLMTDIHSERQTSRSPSQPEKEVTSARIGVFICQCGDDVTNGQISAVIDTQTICEQIADHPDVIHTQVLPFSCSPDAASIINSTVKAHALNRVVLAACSCCNIDQVCYSCTYQRMRTRNNLGIFERQPAPSLGAGSAKFELVNIREQCAWVHADEPQFATHKASTLVEATIARAKVETGKRAGARKIKKTALLLGNGPAAPVCEEILNQLGITTQWITSVPQEIQRSGGLYCAILEEQTWSASTLILIPSNVDEHKGQLIAFGQDRLQPRIRSTWGGLDTHRPGVFYIDPKMDSSVSGSAAAARVAAWIGRNENRPLTAAIVDSDRCRACNTCIDICEYGAPELVEIDGRYASWIDPAICASCGTCAAHCPSGAITAGCSTDDQLEVMLDAILVN